MTVSEPSIEVDNPVVEVGGLVTGRVYLPGTEGVDETVERIREVRVSLRWSTEGRGDRDKWQSPAQVFDIAVDGSLSAPFNLEVPALGPISYDGTLFRVLWTVEARTDLRLRLDKKVKAPIVVVPTGGLGFYQLPHPLPGRLADQ